MSASTQLYFAYGSNMLTRRVRQRAPSARFVATGYLAGRRLTFDKVGRDDSGKCNAEVSGRAADRVHGVVFEVVAAELDALDRAEGAGVGYERRSIGVETALGTLGAFVYVAMLSDPGLRPFHWYKQLVVRGALEHGLPAAYIRSLEAFESIGDRDDARCAQYRALLEAMPEAGE